MIIKNKILFAFNLWIDVGYFQGRYIALKEGSNGCGSCHSQRNNLDLAKHLIIPFINTF
jgi:hypothetical protein